MKRFLVVMMLSLALTFGCVTVANPTAKKEMGGICYYGDVGPVELLDSSKYELVKVNGEVAMLHGPGFVVVGFRAVSPNMKIKEVMAIAVPNGIAAYVYKVNGKWYAFSFSPKENCYIYEGEHKADDAEAFENIYRTIFQKENC